MSSTKSNDPNFPLPTPSAYHFSLQIVPQFFATHIVAQPPIFKHKIHNKKTHTPSHGQKLDHKNKFTWIQNHKHKFGVTYTRSTNINPQFFINAIRSQTQFPTDLLQDLPWERERERGAKSYPTKPVLNHEAQLKPKPILNPGLIKPKLKLATIAHHLWPNEHISPPSIFANLCGSVHARNPKYQIASKSDGLRLRVYGRKDLWNFDLEYRLFGLLTWCHLSKGYVWVMWLSFPSNIIANLTSGYKV